MIKIGKKLLSYIDLPFDYEDRGDKIIKIEWGKEEKRTVLHRPWIYISVDCFWKSLHTWVLDLVDVESSI